jgi:hypothetical protein
MPIQHRFHRLQRPSPTTGALWFVQNASGGGYAYPPWLLMFKIQTVTLHFLSGKPVYAYVHPQSASNSFLDMRMDVIAFFGRRFYYFIEIYWLGAIDTVAHEFAKFFKWLQNDGFALNQSRLQFDFSSLHLWSRESIKTAEDKQICRYGFGLVFITLLLMNGTSLPPLGTLGPSISTQLIFADIATTIVQHVVATAFA